MGYINKLLLICPLRSNERGLTQRAFRPLLRTAPQTTSHPAPSPQYRNCLYMKIHDIDSVFVPYVLHLLYMLTYKCALTDKPSRSETLRRNWTRPSGPGGRTPRASEWDRQVGKNREDEAFTTMGGPSHPVSFYCRSNLSVTSYTTSWLTRTTRGACFHPTHKTANGQISTLKTQREEGKLQATIIFNTLLECIYIYII